MDLQETELLQRTYWFKIRELFNRFHLAWAAHKFEDTWNQIQFKVFLYPTVYACLEIVCSLQHTQKKVSKYPSYYYITLYMDIGRYKAGVKQIPTSPVKYMILRRLWKAYKNLPCMGGTDNATTHLTKQYNVMSTKKILTAT